VVAILSHVFFGKGIFKNILKKRGRRLDKADGGEYIKYYDTSTGTGGSPPFSGTFLRYNQQRAFFFQKKS
jgi:uncharacterized protein (DUF2235 family)